MYEGAKCFICHLNFSIILCISQPFLLLYYDIITQTIVEIKRARVCFNIHINTLKSEFILNVMLFYFMCYK